MAAVKRFGRRVQRSLKTLATLLALLAVAPPPLSHAQGQVHGVEAIGRATLDGSVVEQTFIGTPRYSTGVTVDGHHVYWANYDSSTSPGSYSIGRAGLDGSSVEHRFISRTSPVGDVAVDGAHIYWTNQWDGTIGRADLDGTNADPNFIAAQTPYPRALAVDAQHLYWTTGTYDAYTIARANIDGSGLDPNFIDLPGPSASYGLDVDADYVYWTNFSHSLGRANLDGSGVNPDFVTGLAGNLLGLDVSSDHIYWTSPRQWTADDPPGGPVGSIGRANLDGSGVEQSFITGESHVVDVAADAAHIYWVNQAEYQTCFHCNEPLPPGDNTPPNTTLTKDVPRKIHKTKVRFGFTSRDVEAGFQCRLDKQDRRACISPKTFRHLREGRHVFRVWAVDPSGNADPRPAKDRFRVAL